MSTIQTLFDNLQSHFGDRIKKAKLELREVTIELDPSELKSVCLELRDHADFHFEQLIDLCGIDDLT